MIMEAKSINLSFKHPFTLSLFGPTGSGKTNFALNLIKNRDNLISSKVDKIIIFYDSWQEEYSSFPDITFVNKVPSVSEFKSYTDPYKFKNGSLVILDDALSSTNIDIEKLFTIHSHHQKASLIYISQVVFSNNPYFRTISNNCLYILLLKNPRNLQVSNFLLYIFF